MLNAKSQNVKGLHFPDRITYAIGEIPDYPLTIIEAPMGYGKTTAVRECMKSQETNIYWQRVFGSSKNEFWTGFCGMFREFDTECFNSLAQLGFPSDSLSRQEALNIIEAIDFPKKTVLVIDDYHVAECSETNTLIEYLVRNEIPDLNIVLTVRYMNFQNLDELKLKGYLKHITKETFEFGTNEIKLYYKSCGINLKESQADKLYAVTEGWISALYLMMLNFIDEGSFSNTSNIYKLVENTLYLPLSDEIKEFFQVICLFDSFTLEQAIHMWQKENADILLLEITKKNALMTYDEKTRTYQMHNIFTKLLKEIFDSRRENDKKQTYKRIAHWYVISGDFFSAMNYFHLSEDFEGLMSVVEMDKGHCIYNERKDKLIQFFEECPNQVKDQHPMARLIFIVNLFMFNEFERFEKECGSFAAAIQSNNDLDEESLNVLLGEFQLLLCITGYNDVSKMLEHIKNANALLKQTTEFIDTKEAWTFGSPSVLYMFYRETGKLQLAVENIKEALPYYSRITNGHGKGGEYIMEAEWYFNRGDFQNAEIIANKALGEAARWRQYDINLCCMFLLARIALFKGDYLYLHNIYKKLHEEMTQKKQYNLLHTLDLCAAFINAAVGRKQGIPQWIENGDFESSRLFFPALAFMNIVYGKILLTKGEYYKLLGLAEEFIGISSVFPNLLGHIYTDIYIAAASEKIHRRKEALEALKSALDIAMVDKVYMPFVENGDFIKQLMEEIRLQGFHREGITNILALYELHGKSIEKMKLDISEENKPLLAEREMEVAMLASEGYSNREIGERLFVTQNTVKTVLKRVFEKLDIKSRELLSEYSFKHAKK